VISVVVGLRKDKKLRRGSQEILGYLSHVKA
jgi:hypothetical protein